MTRANIDIGIDLGTTNSSVAVRREMGVEVIKNNEEAEYTPSAVWIDSKGRLIVGRRAKEKSGTDKMNGAVGFKRLMGDSKEWVFQRSGRRMRAQDLSAEVLKSLKQDVRQRTGEELQEAVITVPAAFKANQVEATHEAARLAGIEYSVLILEPTAAAMAYALGKDVDNVFWLIYDLGGGTFDACIVQIRDGIFQITAHGGDPNLGGRDIDLAIVDNLLVPALTKERSLTDFRRKNARWEVAFARLSLAAEDAKIRASREAAVDVLIDRLCEDDRGEVVDFDYEIKREDVERLVEPAVLRTINICRDVLAEAHLGAGDVEAVILVGGPTLTPYLRQRLSDPKEGLGIPLEFTVDPITVVARGAAIYASTQPTSRREPVTAVTGQFAVELDYRRQSVDTEPPIGGRVVPPNGESLAGFTIEFANTVGLPNGDVRVPWRSGKLALKPDGSFMTSLWAERGRVNTFRIELCDSTGTRRETVPDRCEYRVDLDPGVPTAIRSISVALATDEVARFVEKGTPLPARRRHPLQSVAAVRKGAAGSVLRIPVVEGEKPRASRNRRIGTLEVGADRLARDVPVGSEVEVTIEMDVSRRITARAFIPVLNEEFEAVIDPDTGDLLDLERMRRDLQEQRERLARCRQKAVTVRVQEVVDILGRIDREQIVQETERLLAASEADREAASACADRILDLTSLLDEAHDALAMPQLVAEAEGLRREIRAMMAKPACRASPGEIQAFEAVEAAVVEAQSGKDPYILHQAMAKMVQAVFPVITRDPAFWVGAFNWCIERKEESTDQKLTEDLIENGRRAVLSGETTELETVVRRMVGLLPTRPPLWAEPQPKEGGSDVGRKRG